MHDFEIRLCAPAGPDGARLSARAWGQAADGELCLDAAERQRLAAWFAAHFDDGPPGAAATLTAAEVGGRLFDALFDARLLRLWQARPPNTHARVVLAWAPDSPELAQLAALPWELLYDTRRGAFLADEDTAIVRRLEGPPRLTARGTVPPWRLVIASADIDPHTASHAGDEVALLRAAALRHGGDNMAWLARSALSAVEVATCEPAAPRPLRQTLQQRASDVLHVIAHGGWDDRCQAGVLLLAPEEGEPSGSGQAVGAEAFAALVAGTGVRLVVLSVCDSGRVAPGGRAGAASLASALVRSGVPAVIAMQTRIEVRAAAAFAREFYARLLAGAAVEAAVHEARLALRALGPGPDWAVPTLYLRTPPDAPPVARRRPTRVQALLLAFDGALAAGVALLAAFLVPGGLDIVSARDTRWAVSLACSGIAVAAFWGAVQRFAGRTRQSPPTRWRSWATMAGVALVLALFGWLAAAASAPKAEARTHGSSRTAHAGKMAPVDQLLYAAELVPQPAPLTLDRPLARQALNAQLSVSVAGVYALRPTQAGRSERLYALHLEAYWPARADGLRYKRVSLGARIEAHAQVLDVWPRGINKPQPGSGALTVDDREEKFEVVPDLPGAIPTAAGTEALGQGARGAWAYWSARGPGESGHVHAYLLLRVAPTATRINLMLRRRVHLADPLFGRPLRREMLEDQQGLLALSLGAL